MNFEDIRLTRVDTLDDVLDFRAWLGERRPILAVDTETTGLNVNRDWIKLAQFGDGGAGWALDYRDWRGAIREAIHDYRRPMVCHNLLYDSKMLKKDGIVIPQQYAHDTMVMAFLMNPAYRMDLKGAAAKYVDPRAQVGKGLLEQAMSSGGFTWETVPTDLPAYWQYGILDTCLTALLAEALWPTIKAQYRYAYELELACIHVLREGELHGILVDEEVRQRTENKLLQDIEELTPQIPIQNPGSDKQVLEYLRHIGAGEHLIFKTDRGNVSVDKNALRYVSMMGFPVADLIEKYRSRSRMLGNYIHKFREYPYGLAVNGVLSASTRPVQARTGRMSITDPPLQTLPRGRVVRDCIVARPGHRILLADFMGMEMRALASLANEETMLAAFARGDDMHNFVATSVYGEGFTKQQRATAKNAGFAKIYGAGLPQFAATAKIPIHEAQAFLAKYDEMFPGVSRYMEEMIEGVRRQARSSPNGMGFVELQDGRHLPIELKKAYVSVNYKIQGGCAVVLKEKLVELDAAGLGPFFRLPVHDEAFFEVPEEHVTVAREIIRRVMPDRTSFPNVVLEIEQDEVMRWGEHYRGDYPAYVPTEPAPWLVDEAA